jgi:predicted nucleic acid-binding protein
MFLVDTSVWIDHLRNDNRRLREMLDSADVLMHPFIVGELALGTLKRRHEMLVLFSEMPQAPVASHAELLRFIDRRNLMGKGIGYVDAHLLAATVLADARIWTLDTSLGHLARSLGIA